MNRELKPYPKYKDSGVEWIGEVPEEWDVLSFKLVLDSVVDYRGKTPEKIDEGVFLVTAKNVKNGTVDYKISREFVEPLNYEEIMRRGKPQLGDVLFTTEAPLGEVANVDTEDIALAQRIIKFRGKKELLNNFYLKYWIMSQGFQDNLQTFATGSTAQGIKSSKLGQLLVILPSYPEQTEISDYLDQKTCEIDALIADKEKLITLLEEKRQAVITETVTKGLNPNVKMKDSGIGWIGEIPAHWSIVKLKHLSNHNFKYGANESAESDNPNQPRYIRITDLTDEGNLKSETFKSLPFKIAAKYPVEKGDILFARSGATVGKTYIHKSNEVASYAGYLIRYRPSNKMALPKYLYYFTKSFIYREWVERNLIQATIENISAEKYANLKIPLTNLDEQEEIIKFLNKYNAETDVVLIQLNQQIMKLKEYRESLIYEAVTGKIDLRDYGEQPEALVAERGEPYGN